MNTRVVERHDLPDGRQLLVYDDGSTAVRGQAQRREHPVPGWEWLGPQRHRPPTVRGRTTGPVPQRTGRPGHRPTRSDASHRRSVGHRDALEAERRAEALLESLLDPDQLRDYRTTRGFWVRTPRGPVRLGELYALVHQPTDQPEIERVLCVVPDDYQDLPLADIWTNLLLTLSVEPEAFFAVAHPRGVRRRHSRRPRVPTP